VASTWLTVYLLKHFPKTELDELAREKLNAHLGQSNLEGEIEFFRATAAAINPIPSANQTGLFERPYGFAWLLKLQSELRTWPDSQAQRWSSNVAPLAAWMSDSLGAYFTKLVEPVRNGGQTNTAQSMTLALDWADVANDAKLRRTIVSAAAQVVFRRQHVRSLSWSACQPRREAAVVAGDEARVEEARRQHGANYQRTERSHRDSSGTRRRGRRARRRPSGRLPLPLRGRAHGSCPRPARLCRMARSFSAADAIEPVRTAHRADRHPDVRATTGGRWRWCTCDRRHVGNRTRCRAGGRTRTRRRLVVLASAGDGAHRARVADK
jgi:hypothetical protein